MCANCKKLYLRESHLQAHVRSHLPAADRPLVCTEIGCSKCFWMMQHLKVHVVSVHRGEKAFCVSQKLFRKVISPESQQPMGRSVLNRCTVVRTPSQKTTVIQTANRLYCLRARTAPVSSVQSGVVRLFTVRCGVLNRTSGITRVIRAQGSGQVRLGVWTDMASASGSLCRLIFRVRDFSRRQRARCEERLQEEQRGRKLQVQSGQYFTAMIFDN